MSLVALGTAALVFARLAGLLTWLPVFSAMGVPKHVPVLVAVSLTAILAPLVPALEAEPTLSVMVLGIAGELMLGSLLGLTVKVVFAALAIGADLAAHQMGLAMAMMLNPMLKSQETPLSVLATMLGGLVFLELGMHLQAIAVLGESFQVVGPGQVGDLSQSAWSWVGHAEQILELGVQLAGPAVVMVWLVHVFVAMLVRLAPKMNIFFALSMSITPGSGILLFAATLPMLLGVHQQWLQRSIVWMREIVSLVP